MIGRGAEVGAECVPPSPFIAAAAAVRNPSSGGPQTQLLQVR